MPDPSNPNSLSDDIIFPIYEDRSGTLWLGSEHGVQKYNLANERFAHHTHSPSNPNSPSHPEVLALYAATHSPGTLWIGTNGGGLDRLERLESRFINYRHDPSNPKSLSDNAVSSIAEDPSGTLWVGTIRGGLNKFDFATGLFTRFQHDPKDTTSLSHNAVHALYIDRRGVLWVGTDGGGLNQFDRAAGTFTRYLHDPGNPTSISNNAIKTIYEDRQGMLWVGTFGGGLNLFNRETGRFTSFRHDPNDPQSLGHDRVVSIYEDPSGTLWLGTYGGLNRFDRTTEHFTYFTEQDGLQSNAVYGVIGDEKGAIWISTSSGLSRFDQQTKTFTNFDVSSGFPDIQLAPGVLAQNEDGELFFGGFNGLTAFDPEMLPNATYQPPLVITSFKKQGEVIATDLDSGAILDLSYKDGLFSFEFALLDYTAPSKHRYQYILEGFDDAWHERNGPMGRATYVNLEERGGNFRFRVRGFKGQGDWSETSILVRIVPPWWRATWFQASVLIGFILPGGNDKYLLVPKDAGGAGGNATHAGRESGARTSPPHTRNPRRTPTKPVQRAP